MKRELNGITDHPTLHWTLCIYVRTNKISFCSLHQNFLHRGDTDAGLWKPRWKAQLSLWKTEVAVVGTHFCFYSSFCISTVQHAFPSSLLHGSGWHHVSDHQHAGVQKHTIHTTADIGNLCICSLGNKNCLTYCRCYGSLGCLKFIIFFWQPFFVSLELPWSLCFTTGPVKILCACVCKYVLVWECVHGCW